MNLEDILITGINIGTYKTLMIGENDTFFYKKIRDTLTLLITSLDNLSIQKETSDEIQEIIQNYDRTIIPWESTSGNSEIAKIDEDLLRKIPIWQDRIATELKTTNVIELLKETTLNPEKLSIGAKAFFDEGIWDLMKDLEKEDLEDGCRCLSVQAWTPASMINMRIVESVLKSYYKKITGKDPYGKQWNNILIELKASSSTDTLLIGYLDYLRDIRNKLQHPDARVEQPEAEAVFHHTLNIINILYS